MIFDKYFLRLILDLKDVNKEHIKKVAKIVKGFINFSKEFHSQREIRAKYFMAQGLFRQKSHDPFHQFGITTKAGLPQVVLQGGNGIL